uniref:Uncharacterized protein n=1 Tax=Anguilla anguilla TaxID=7936 RepID=A0A0E9R4V9_ANGAN
MYWWQFRVTQKYKTLYLW